MSLLEHHLFNTHYLPISRVNALDFSIPTSSPTHVQNFGFTCTAGNLIVAQFGGLQSRTVTAITAGWNLLLQPSGGGGVMAYLYYKVSDGTENTITFSWSGGNLQGGGSISEWKNVIAATQPTNIIYQNGITISSVYRTFNITPTMPQVVLVHNGNDANTGWAIDNGFTVQSNGGGSARWHDAYRIYNAPTGLTETVTTTFGAYVQNRLGYVGFLAKRAA